MKRFDIVTCDLPYTTETSRVLRGLHPAIVISNDHVNAYSPVVTVIPMTSKMKRLDMPTHVPLNGFGLRKPGMALCEQLQSVDRDTIGQYIGTVDDPQVRSAIVRAVGVQLGAV